MTSDYNQTWTAYENDLYLAHQLKLQRPPPEKDPTNSGYLSFLLHRHHLLLQELVEALDRNQDLDDVDFLRSYAGQLVDTPTRLATREALMSSSHFYRLAFLAVKVKGLKELRGVGPEGRRSTIMGALGKVVRKYRQLGFAGYSSRFYVLLNAVWLGPVLAGHLKAELDVVLESLGLADLEDPPRPYLITGIGRTWEEAHLITRGCINQADVPIDFRENPDDKR